MLVDSIRMDQASGSVITEEWSVHAQLVVHHGNLQQEQQQPSQQQQQQPLRTQSGDGGVRMEYCWEPGINSIWETSGSKPFRPSYGFQKGSLLFTTTPPQCGINRISENAAGHSQTFPRYPAKSQDGSVAKNSRNVSKSPITTSESIPSSSSQQRRATGPLFDSGYASEKFNTLPSRRPPQPYERRCRSTCSITLSCDVPCDKSVNRTQSLKSPNATCSRCGTPKADDCSSGGNVCEECKGSKKTSRAHTFTTHFCTHVVNDSREKNIKDASSQTQNEQTDQTKDRISPPKKEDDRTFLLKPEIVIPEAPEGTKPKQPERKKLSRSPARLHGKSPFLSENVKSGQERDAKKQPRTVHIDVYCTGSDEADDSESATSEEEPVTRTVYENKDVRVTHRRAGRNELPSRRKNRIPNLNVAPLKNEKRESEDDLSSHYPSAQSSRTTLLESFGSLPTVSSANVLRSDDTIATSWKDTECCSLEQSGVSLIDGSGISLTQSDSFEYADSVDKQRIKELENRLSGVTTSDSKTWKSPQMERRNLLREKIFNDYLQSHVESFPLWKRAPFEDSSESDDSHESEIGWTFTHAGEDNPSASQLPKTNSFKGINKTGKDSGKSVDSGSLSDSTPSTIYRYKRRAVLGPFGVRPPSPLPAKLENTRTSPFTSSFKGKTECFQKAEKFGEIVGVLKKPGHHVGPAKNPDCTCKSCRWYFEENKGRGRTRSVGDIPVKRRTNCARKQREEQEVDATREEISGLITEQWDLIQNLV